jgi:hypothetical protein
VVPLKPKPPPKIMYAVVSKNNAMIIDKSGKAIVIIR